MTDRTSISDFATSAASDLAIVLALCVLAVVVSSILGAMGWAGVAEVFDMLGGR